MRLPNAESASIDIDRLRNYSLNPSHPEGKHKARVFAAALGFRIADAEKLRTMIFQAISIEEAETGLADEHGSRYAVDFRAQGLREMVTIRTAWIVDQGETAPRLVSCYVKRKKPHG